MGAEHSSIPSGPASPPPASFQHSQSHTRFRSSSDASRSSGNSYTSHTSLTSYHSTSSNVSHLGQGVGLGVRNNPGAGASPATASRQGTVAGAGAAQSLHRGPASHPYKQTPTTFPAANTHAEMTDPTLQRAVRSCEMSTLQDRYERYLDGEMEMEMMEMGREKVVVSGRGRRMGRFKGFGFGFR